MRLFNLIGAVGFAAMLGGCAGASSPAPPAAQSVAPGAFAGRDAGGAQRTLFIADVDSNVLFYTADINEKNPPPLGEITFTTISSGLYAPSSCAVDRVGNLYVGDQSGGGVTPDGTIYWPNYDEEAMYEFAPGASSPTNVFPTNGSGVGTAVDYW